MQKVIVGFDASNQALDALELSRTLCKTLEADLVVAVVDEVEPYFEDFGPWARGRKEFYARVLESARELLREFDVIARTGVGSVSAALESIATADEADLIVVGSTHRGMLGRILPGSVGDRLLNGAPCAVAVAPNGYRERRGSPLRTIGVGYDGEAEARDALRFAESLARATGASLRIIAVARPLIDLVPAPIPTRPGYEQALHNHLTEAIEQGLESIGDGVASESVLAHGDPAGELIEQSAELDLLLLGSSGYGPLSRVVMGGVTRRVVCHASCPVIVLPRSSEDASPTAGANRENRGAEVRG